MTVAPIDLVVGADGMIGAALLRGLRAAGRSVLGTSRRSEADGAAMQLDLNNPPSRWDGPPVATAYLCAAVARLDACRRDPAAAAKVNVEGAVRLSSALVAKGAFVVFLSTNHVFDGTLPYRRPEEPTCPLNEYGRQKATAEEQILALGNTAVVRLTKVLGERVPLFDAWTAALRKGEPIRPYSDMSMAPVALATVVEVLAALGPQRLVGVHHLSGNRDVSYARVAQTVADLLGADKSLVEPVAAAQADPSAEPPPRYTTLDVAGLPARLGIVLPDVDETIRAAMATEVGRGRSAA